METIKANVAQFEEKHFIKIVAGDEEIKIPMSEDKPNDVKSAFNKIIAKMKDGAFQIELEEIKEDLFSQVANEYITQKDIDLETRFDVISVILNEKEKKVEHLKDAFYPIA